MKDDERIGAPRMVKKLVEIANYDLIMFLGDDTIPHAGFIDEAVKVMNTFDGGWGLVGLNVLEERRADHPEAPATHWLAHKKLLDHLDGEFFHTGYIHCFCDNELTLRCKEMGRFKRAEKSVISHEHPIFKKAKWDRDYLKVYSHESMLHDTLLFQQRRGESWRTISD